MVRESLCGISDTYLKVDVVETLDEVDALLEVDTLEEVDTLKFQASNVLDEPFLKKIFEIRKINGKRLFVWNFSYVP